MFVKDKYIESPIFTYIERSVWLFERIKYLQNVLNDPSRVNGAPDRKEIVEELLRTIHDYEDAVCEKYDMDCREFKKAIENARRMYTTLSDDVKKNVDTVILDYE